MWYGRKSAAGAFSRLSPSYYLTDVTVRRSLLGPVLQEILAVCDKYDVRTANFFHAGDGNLHPLILCDESDAELMERVHKAGKEIIQICLDNDGSITGEHGVGMEKRGYMTAMYSGAELAAMVAVKDVFDPNNLCNPGKVLPRTCRPRTVSHPPQPSLTPSRPRSPRRPRPSCRVHPRRTHRAHRPRT
ncbi:MAG: FAD-linked oxidase C-terminal domain-containing protein [Caldilineaceae bacterium]